ncbi:MAG: cytochrome c biogenesis protein CcsA [Gammaproteobacteria bacterium]|nr:cytochrome c biogenesis protein CcsA [Gammaproteobacteria bacterium]
METTIAGLLGALLYLTACVILGKRLVAAQGKGGAIRIWNDVTYAAAICLHTLVLYQAIVTDSGLNLGFFNAVSLVSWVIVVLLLLAAISKPVENLGLLVLPVAAMALLLSISFQSQHYLPRDAGFGLEIHIILAIIAYSLLTIAALQSLLLAFQDYQLRHKHPGGILRALPPLQTMETLLFQLITLGFFLLSLAVISGMMFLEDMFAQRVAHKTILSILAWVIFATLLWGRYRFGWRGRVAIRWSIGGFVALMLAFFGSKLVIELILQH